MKREQFIYLDRHHLEDVLLQKCFNIPWTTLETTIEPLKIVVWMEIFYFDVTKWTNIIQGVQALINRTMRIDRRTKTNSYINMVAKMCHRHGLLVASSDRQNTLGPSVFLVPV